MRKSRFTEEQIIGILKEHQAGLSAAEVCRRNAPVHALASSLRGFARGRFFICAVDRTGE